jgi:hypothetical protein
MSLSLKDIRLFFLYLNDSNKGFRLAIRNKTTLFLYITITIVTAYVFSHYYNSICYIFLSYTSHKKRKLLRSLKR